MAALDLDELLQQRAAAEAHAQAETAKSAALQQELFEVSLCICHECCQAAKSAVIHQQLLGVSAALHHSVGKSATCL